MKVNRSINIVLSVFLVTLLSFQVQAEFQIISQGELSAKCSPPPGLDTISGRIDTSGNTNLVECTFGCSYSWFENTEGVANPPADARITMEQYVESGNRPEFSLTFTEISELCCGEHSKSVCYSPARKECFFQLPGESCESGTAVGHGDCICRRTIFPLDGSPRTETFNVLCDESGEVQCQDVRTLCDPGTTKIRGDDGSVDCCDDEALTSSGECCSEEGKIKLTRGSTEKCCPSGASWLGNGGVCCGVDLNQDDPSCCVGEHDDIAGCPDPVIENLNHDCGDCSPNPGDVDEEIGCAVEISYGYDSLTFTDQKTVKKTFSEPGRDKKIEYSFDVEKGTDTKTISGECNVNVQDPESENCECFCNGNYEVTSEEKTKTIGDACTVKKARSGDSSNVEMTLDYDGPTSIDKEVQKDFCDNTVTCHLEFEKREINKDCKDCSSVEKRDGEPFQKQDSDCTFVQGTDEEDITVSVEASDVPAAASDGTELSVSYEDGGVVCKVPLEVKPASDGEGRCVPDGYNGNCPDYCNSWQDTDCDYGRSSLDFINYFLELAGLPTVGQWWNDKLSSWGFDEVFQKLQVGTPEWIVDQVCESGAGLGNKVGSAVGLGSESPDDYAGDIDADWVPPPNFLEDTQGISFGAEYDGNNYKLTWIFSNYDDSSYFRITLKNTYGVADFEPLLVLPAYSGGEWWGETTKKSGKMWQDITNGQGSFVAKSISKEYDQVCLKVKGFLNKEFCRNVINT